MTDDAWIVINPDGTWADANEQALRVLGLESADQLRGLPSDAFSVRRTSEEEGAAFRAAWAAQGSAPIVGEAPLRRADGKEVWVKFLIAQQDDGRYLAVLRPAAPRARPSSALITAGELLSAWRTAERRLEGLSPGSPEWLDAQAEVEAFRDQYRVHFERARQRSNPE